MTTVHFGGVTDPWFTVDINPVAFEFAGISVRWYGIFIGIGMILAVMYACRYARSFGIDSDRMIDVAILSIAIGVIGARLYYVLFNLDEYKKATFWDILNIRDGGLAIYGGIICGMLSAWGLCKWRKIKVLPMLDLGAIGFLIGQGLGRWGNFTNQEAFGCNTNLPWGMYSLRTNHYLTMHRLELLDRGIVINAAQMVHPCFLYEFLWCLLGFLLIHFFVRKRRQYDGQILLLYLLWYGLGRFWIEGLRIDSLMWGPYRISQLLAGVCVFVTAILLWNFRKHRGVFGEEGLKLQLAEEAVQKEQKAAAKAEAKAAKAAKAAKTSGAETDEPEQGE